MKAILSSDTMDIPDGVTVKIMDEVIEVEGPLGKLALSFKHVNLNFQLITDEVTGRKKLKAEACSGSRKTTADIRTALSHVENLTKKVTKGYRHKTPRFAYSPINASIKNSGNILNICED